jgi:hypothetical protein
MSNIRNQSILAAVMLCLAVSATLPARAEQPPTPPDATLYTTYTLYSEFQTVTWSVCGSTQQSEGCYSNGSLGPFNEVGALMEGNSSVVGNVVTRAIYVVDSGNASDVLLYVYKKTDTVTADFDSVTVTLVKTVILPLTGGSSAICSMGANNLFLFIGTDQSPQAVRVQKSNLAITQLGGFSPPINVAAITADNYGYVTVTQGDFSGNGSSASTVFGPDGSEQEDGGGAFFMLNTRTAVSSSTLPHSDNAPPQRLGVRPRVSN